MKISHSSLASCLRNERKVVKRIEIKVKKIVAKLRKCVKYELIAEFHLNKREANCEIKRKTFQQYFFYNNFNSAFYTFTFSLLFLNTLPTLRLLLFTLQTNTAEKYGIAFGAKRSLHGS